MQHTLKYSTPTKRSPVVCLMVGIVFGGIHGNLRFPHPHTQRTVRQPVDDELTVGSSRNWSIFRTSLLQFDFIHYSILSIRKPILPRQKHTGQRLLGTNCRRNMLDSKQESYSPRLTVLSPSQHSLQSPSRGRCYGRQQGSSRLG